MKFREIKSVLGKSESHLLKDTSEVHLPSEMNYRVLKLLSPQICSWVPTTVSAWTPCVAFPAKHLAIPSTAPENGEDKQAERQIEKLRSGVSDEENHTAQKNTFTVYSWTERQDYCIWLNKSRSWLLGEQSSGCKYLEWVMEEKLWWTFSAYSGSIHIWTRHA